MTPIRITPSTRKPRFPKPGMPDHDQASFSNRIIQPCLAVVYRSAAAMLPPSTVVTSAVVRSASA
jgi:hypothetical protein